MTRADYELIAATLARCAATGGPMLHNAYACAMADALAGINPRFDRARFLAACAASEYPRTTLAAPNTSNARARAVAETALAEARRKRREASHG